MMMMPISGRRGLYARHCWRSQSRGRWERGLVISRAAFAAADASLSFLSSSSGGDDIVVACVGPPASASALRSRVSEHLYQNAEWIPIFSD